MEIEEKQPVPDAYAEYVARRRAQRAQEPEEELFDVKLSEDAIRFTGAALELVQATTPEGQVAKREVEAALLSAVRDRLRKDGA